MHRLKITNPTFILLFLIFTGLSFNSLLPQTLTFGELMIVNNTGTAAGKLIKVNIYPDGAIFSGGWQYSLDARFIVPNSSGKIYGTSKILQYNQNLTEDQWTLKINFDATSDVQFCESSLGYGKYRIDFYAGDDIDNFILVDHCTVDYSDANYGTSNFQGEQKIRIDCRPLNEFTFNFLSSNTPHNINEVGGNIRVWEQYGSGFPQSVPSKGLFNDTTLTQYHDFPIDATQFGAVEHLNPGEFKMNMSVKYSGSNIRQNQILKFNKSTLTINEGIDFPINQAAYMNFTGKGAKFIAKNNSLITVPSEFVINLDDSSDINLDGTKITTSSIGNTWRGIRLKNIGSDSYVKNSILENADTLVFMTDQMGRPFRFESNIVNLNRAGAGYRAGLNFRNAYNILIRNNEFHLPSVDADGNYREAAVHISNFQNLNSIARATQIIVKDNKFYGGYYQFNLLAFTSNFTTALISGNIFNNSFYNILLRKCAGDIKNNIFANDVLPLGIASPANCLTNFGVINYYANEFQSGSYNILSGFHSYSNLAPVRDENNQLIWTGGFNSIVNSTLDNIFTFGGGGYIFTNKGKNNFTISSPIYKHINGEIDDTSTIYYANDNCWHGNNEQPVINLYNSSGITIPFQSVPTPNCSMDFDPLFSISFERDYEITDTVFVSDNISSDAVPEDEKKYSESIKHLASEQLQQALNDLEVLISCNSESKFSAAAVQKLYELYCEKDAMSNYANTNSLFGSFKNFLETSVLANGGSEEFIEVCCEIILMCDVKTKNYNAALTGYEYIAENDPSFDDRIFASLEYLSASTLANGSGGGKTSKKYDYPVNKILKKLYSKKTYDKKSSSSDRYERNIAEKKVKEILTCSRSLSKEEKIKKVEEETFLLFAKNSNKIIESTDKSKNNVNLLQNYPNPFNPTTQITFELPEDGTADLIIYDISGKEIIRLINNQFRAKGNYSVSFSGANLSSGIYFYTLKVHSDKITTGEYVQTRRMVLIK